MMRRVDVVRDREETRTRAWRSIFAGGRKGGEKVCWLVDLLWIVSETYTVPTNEIKNQFSP